MSRRAARFVGLFVLLPALTGCGDEGSSPSDFPHARVASGATRHRATVNIPTLPKPKPTASDDPLASAPDTVANGPESQDADTLATTVPPPTATDAETLGDAQPRMPTQHSHWLKGSLMDAHLVVTLNQAPLATYDGPMDQDITMRCRPGVNTITFAYTPSSRNSFADVRVLESEHNPPIAPLATFNTQPLTVIQSGDQKPLTQTYTFIAH